VKHCAAETVWVPVENPSVEALECLVTLVGLSGFESRDPGRVVIDFGVARVSMTWSKGTVEIVVISR
jgi:hypothetical protein